MLTEVKSSLRYILLSIKYNVQREMLNRASFLTNVLLMMINNLSIVVQWLVFFSLKPDFGGYTFEDQMLAVALCTVTYGMVYLFFAGVDNIAKYIEQGALDKYLTKPKSPLIGVLTSKTQISALGDLLFGIIIFFIYYHNPVQFLLFLVCSFFSFLIMLSFFIIVNSITFWFIRFSDTKQTFTDSYISFSLYPYTVFGNFVTILMHTIIPVGFAIYLPVTLFQDFSITKLLILIGFAVFNMALAVFLFNRGLKRYTSSSMAVVNV